MSTFAGGSVGGGAQSGKALVYWDPTQQARITIDQSTAPIQIQQLKLASVFNKSTGMVLTGDEAETTPANRRTRIVVQGNVQNYGLTTEATALFSVKLDADRYLFSVLSTGSQLSNGESFLTATPATRTIGTPASNAVIYTAVQGGKTGNNISVEQLANGGLGAGTAIAGIVVTDPVTNTVTITVEHNAATASTIAAAVNSTPSVAKFVTASNSGNGTGTTGVLSTLSGGQLDVLISGNLTIQGQTTTVSTTHLVITDPVIFLNKDAVSATTSGGVAFSRGGGGNYDALWFWNETDDRFELGYANTSGGTVNPSTLLSFRPIKSAWDIFPDNAGDPANLAGHGQVYSKTQSGIVELFYKDGSNNVVQITSGGTVNGGSNSTGTTSLSFTINSDGVAGTSEQAYLDLLSGNGASNLYTGTLRQQSSGTYAGALAAFTRINTSPADGWLSVGEPLASGNNRSASFSMFGTNGSATLFEARFSYAPGTDSSTVYLGNAGDATSLAIKNNLRFANLSNGNHNINAIQAAGVAGSAAGGDTLTISAGRGQPRTNAGGAGGTGGTLYVGGADGGNGTGGANGGNGGNLELFGGNGGNGAATTNGNPGNVLIYGGGNGPGGAVGNVSIGTTNTTTITLGASANNVIIDSAVAQFRTPHVRFPEIAADPSSVADTGFVYTKDVASRTELFYEDSSGAVVQITSNGTVNGGGGTSTGTSSLTYQINNDATGGVAENPALIMSGGNGSGTVRNTRFGMVSGIPTVWRVDGSTIVNSSLYIGASASAVNSLTSNLSLVGTNGSGTDFTATFSWTPATTTRLVMAGDLTGFTGNSTAAFTLATQSNQNIVLAPNGTGQLQTSTDTIAGTNGSGLTITTSVGALNLTSTSNTNVVVPASGTGSLSVSRNLVFGTDATYKIGASSSTNRPQEVHVSDVMTLGNTVLSLSILSGNLVATSSGAMSFTTATNSNLNLTAQGTGNVVVSAPVLRPSTDNTTALGTASQQYTNLFLTGYAKHVASSDPSTVAGAGFIYVKTISTNPELVYRDGSGNIVQITNNGAVNSGPASVPTYTAISTLTNNSGGTLTQGTAVYISGSNTFGSAQADAAGTSTVFGVVSAASIANSATGEVATSGVVTVPTGKQTGTWVANDIIYLDPATAGKLTNVAPSTTGQYAVEVGISLNTPAGGNASLLIRQQNKVLVG